MDAFESVLQDRAARRDRGRAVSKANGNGNGGGKLNGASAGAASDGDAAPAGAAGGIDWDALPAQLEALRAEAGGGADPHDYDAIWREIREAQRIQRGETGAAGKLNGASAAESAASDGGDAHAGAAPAFDVGAADSLGLRDPRLLAFFEQQRIERGDPETPLATALRKLGAESLASARRLAVDGLTRADALLWYDLSPAERRALNYKRADAQALNRAAWSLLTAAERTAYRQRRDGAGDAD